MITILSSTNRSGSYTYKISKICHEILEEKLGEKVYLMDLEMLNNMPVSNDMYSENGQHQLIRQVQDDLLVPSDKWIIVSPEYNGSFPGILKFFIDSLSVRRYTETFKGKKVALIGVGSGRGGNLRGMEHLTGFLNYLKMVVMPEKLPISSVNKMFENNELTDSLTKDELNRFLNEFARF